MFLQEEADRVEHVVVVVLGEYTSGDVVGSGRFHYDRAVEVEVTGDWGCGEALLELVEGLLAVGIKEKQNIFPSQRCKRASNIGVILNKPANRDLQF